jgi:hypothetical protein
MVPANSFTFFGDCFPTQQAMAPLFEPHYQPMEETEASYSRRVHRALHACIGVPHVQRNSVKYRRHELASRAPNARRCTGEPASKSNFSQNQQLASTAAWARQHVWQHGVATWCGTRQQPLCHRSNQHHSDKVKPRAVAVCTSNARAH